MLAQGVGLLNLQRTRAECRERKAKKGLVVSLRLNRGPIMFA